jgi:hypothetical protein
MPHDHRLDKGSDAAVHFFTGKTPKRFPSDPDNPGAIEGFLSDSARNGYPHWRLPTGDVIVFAWDEEQVRRACP